MCDYCIPRTNVHGGYYGLVVIKPRPPPPSRRHVRRHTDMSSFNITDTQTYLYCHVAIIIDNLTDIIALSGWQYLLIPMSLLPMCRYIYIAVSVVLWTPVTISLTCRHRLTYIDVSVVLLTPVTISLTCRHRLTYITVSVVLLTPVTISLTCRHMLTYIAVSVVIIGNISPMRRHRPYLYCHVGDIIDSCDNIGSNIATYLHCCVSSNY